jgi:hypothetical protein
MVDWDEFGSGGKGCTFDGSEVDFADTTTVASYKILGYIQEFLLAFVSISVHVLALGEIKINRCPNTHFARSIAICRPMPLDAPITRATFPLPSFNILNSRRFLLLKCYSLLVAQHSQVSIGTL